MPTPIAVFEENLADAQVLLKFAEGLRTERAQRMRSERREALRRMWRLSAAEGEQLDRAESDHLFVVMRPGSVFNRDDFTEPALRPLLRQAIVALSAAIETYVSDRAEDFVGEAIKDPPSRLSQVPLDLKTVLEIDAAYTRRGWGYREVLVTHLRQQASPAPSKITQTFLLVGRKIKWSAIDSMRGVDKGTSEKHLQEIYGRRNDIAHAADRVGRTRRVITTDEVRTHIGRAKEIIEALDQHLTDVKRAEQA